MSKLILLAVLMLGSIVTIGQNINVTFAGSGDTNRIDSVTATNLTTKQSVTLPGNETLVLTLFSGIPEVTGLDDAGMVFPNPFISKATFSTSSGTPRMADLKLQTPDGRILANTRTLLEPGNNVFELSVARAGIYIFCITTIQGTAGYKIVCTGNGNIGNGIRYVGLGSGISGNRNHNSQPGFKISQTGYILGYSPGDIIQYECRSGIYTTLFTDSPTVSIKYNVELTNCSDPGGSNYPVVVIGTQTWMAQNLAWLPAVSPPSMGSDKSKHYYVYDYNGSNVTSAKATAGYKAFGALYNWDAARTACPSGWHLPSDPEWKVLERYLGMNTGDVDKTSWRLSGNAGRKLKSVAGWSGNPGNGSNLMQFNALPGGWRNYGGSFDGTGIRAWFWTSSGYGDTQTWSRGLSASSDGISRDLYDYSYGLSVRCIKGAGLPAVTTSVITEITENTAASGGNVLDDGGADVTDRGVCWNTTGSPTVLDDKTMDGSGTGPFNSLLSGLESGTDYYVRAYASNVAGTAYGDEQQFTTDRPASLPTVTTDDITDISQTSATCGGEVTDDGGAEVTARGVCWNTSGMPDISNLSTTDGSGTGDFSSSLTGLTPDTPYYIRAYATNKAGTAYGPQKQFSTLEEASLPTVTTDIITNIDKTSATGGGNVISDGGASVTARGVCWNTTGSPEINDSQTVEGSGTGTFTCSLTGLTEATPYFARAFATNSAGTAYGEERQFATAGGSDEGSFEYDGRTYSYKKIGTQIWMTENLAFLPSVSPSASGSESSPFYYVYGYEGTNVNEARATGNYSTYGVLYNWAAANMVCPAGWALPTDEELKTLEKNLLMLPSDADAEGIRWSGDVGGKLKETGTAHWISPNVADNESGFTALPGGARWWTGGMRHIGDTGYFWTASAKDATTAWSRHIVNDDTGVRRNPVFKSQGYSVRCLKY